MSSDAMPAIARTRRRGRRPRETRYVHGQTLYCALDWGRTGMAWPALQLDLRERTREAALVRAPCRGTGHDGKLGSSASPAWPGYREGRRKYERETEPRVVCGTKPWRSGPSPAPYRLAHSQG